MKLNHACALLTASLLPLSPLWLKAQDAVTPPPTPAPPADTATPPPAPPPADTSTPSSTSSTPLPGTPPSLPPAQNAHTEAVNRQQLIVNANQAISDGQRLLGSGHYDEAANRFQFALDCLTPGGASAASYNRAETGLAAAKAGQAQALAKDYKFAQAARPVE